MDLSFVEDITVEVIEKLNNYIINSDGDYFINIEMIHDQIEIELMEAGHFHVMKHFIIYRNDRIKQREKEKQKVEKKLEQKTYKIIKKDQEKENFDIEKIRKTYKIVSY
jgi:ribonucleoside-diphosphate reductase alpha chain